ncbi:hypothetical protein [Desulfofustis limnaeus]|uniref:hypothetical protein n=1 Tax=Desulfofustis limnaeus TaxID=2740163 RepID=UPI0024DFD9FA|nr:hypothetical protein [Desulfofustis limnaeus]MDX9895541.1 hypothetical protein [Desulfofustis sp.]
MWITCLPAMGGPFGDAQFRHLNTRQGEVFQGEGGFTCAVGNGDDPASWHYLLSFHLSVAEIPR